MMTEYRTVDGDVLDAICAKHYGTERGTTEAVLLANPGLADRGTHYPTGLIIHLPLLETPAETVQTVNLWD